MDLLIVVVLKLSVNVTNVGESELLLCLLLVVAIDGVVDVRKEGDVSSSWFFQCKYV